MKPRLLDLFCGAGGAAVGYARAGFEVVGVDLVPQPNYPFRLIEADALEYLREWTTEFDAIHASPPCQAYSDRTPAGYNHPDLVAPIRALLRATGLPYVIENVEGAPLENPVRLCGTSFPGLRVIRHRLFETNWPLLVPPCGEHPLLYMPDKRRPHQGELDELTAFVSVTGGGNCSVVAARSAMGIDWMTKDELNDAIPPAFTEYVGTALLDHLRATKNLVEPEGVAGNEQSFAPISPVSAGGARNPSGTTGSTENQHTSQPRQNSWGV